MMKINKKIIYIPLLLTILVLTGCSTAKKDTATTLLWEVRSKIDTSKVMYLLGSIHFATKDMYPLSPIIMDAWNKSNALCVEMNVNDIDASQLFGDMGSSISMLSQFVSFSNPLSSRVSPDVFKKIEERFTEMGLPDEIVNNLDYFTPLMVTLLLDMGDIMAKKKDTSSTSVMADEGIDQHFLSLAEGEGKPIVSLETLQSQIDALKVLGDVAVDYIKVQLADNNKDEAKDPMAIFKAWKSADVEYFKKTIEDMGNAGDVNRESIEKIKNALIFDRNKQMAKKIESYLNEEKTYFVVVGAGHYVGDGSIVDILQKTGRYDIKRK